MENFRTLINQTKKWMEQYTPEKLLEWIQTCSIYPGNQRYQLRISISN